VELSHDPQGLAAANSHAAVARAVMQGNHPPHCRTTDRRQITGVPDP
jgi:hypothetical protein